MPPDPRLYNASVAILDNLVTDLTARGIDVPTRQYIHSGQIVHDLVGDKCADQIAVSWQGTTPGAVEAAGGGGAPLIQCAMPFTYQWEVALLRCVPTFKMASGNAYIPPTVVQFSDSANEIQKDAATLVESIVTLVLSNDFVGDNIDIVGMGNVLPIGPSGGAGGTSVTFFATLL